MFCFLCKLALAMALVPLSLGKFPSRQQADSGFCQVLETNNILWLSCPAISPEPILTIGANHVSNSCRGPGVSPSRPSTTAPYADNPAICMTWDLSINASAYRDTTLALYGSDAGWAKSTAGRLKTWGFNTAGAWSSVDLEVESELLVAVLLDMGMSWTETVERLFPDVFDPAWAAHVAQVAENECSTRKDSQYLLGYFPDNELNWEGRWPANSPSISESLLTWFLLRPAGTPGLSSATNFLMQRYNGSLSALNTAWGTSATSWSTLGRAAPYPTPATTARSGDESDFLALVAERYHKTIATAIRAVDPNHLIIGYRYYGAVLKPLAAAVGRHFDVVDYHAYTAKAPIDDLAVLHNASGLPVMVSEFGFRASDSGLPNTRGAGPVFNTQTARTAGYRGFITDLVKLPYLVGYHVFAWVDEPASGNGWKENSNYGMVHLDDSPYPVLTQMYSQLHTVVDALHRNAH